MTRPIIPGTVYPDALKQELSVAAIPSKNTKKLVNTLKKVFPQTIPATNVLETSIGSPNPSIHPAPTLLNMATWEKAHGDIQFQGQRIDRIGAIPVPPATNSTWRSALPRGNTNEPYGPSTSTRRPASRST
jgi:hypothetical protein